MKHLNNYNLPSRKLIRRNKKIQEEIENIKKYSEYLYEQLKNSIKYSEYLKDKLEMNIKFSEYIGDNLEYFMKYMYLKYDREYSDVYDMLKEGKTNEEIKAFLRKDKIKRILNEPI